MWPFRSRSRPHPRFVNACPGTGMMPFRSDYVGYPTCPVCGAAVKLRKHRDTTHNWPAGSLRLHSRPRDEAKLTWYERFLGLGRI